MKCKCCKCCAKIAEKEEIKDYKSFYCEACWKSDSWRRTGSQVLFSGFVVLAIIMFLCIIYLIWKNSKSEECDKEHIKD